MRNSSWYGGAALVAAALMTAPMASATISFVSQPGDSVFCGVYDVCDHLMPITVSDGTTFTTVTDGTETATFSSALTAGTVPTSWSTWNSPPAVESSTPRVGEDIAATSLTITLSLAVEVFGFELEPNNSGPFQTTVSFFNGATPLGGVTLFPNGSSGALLFAADAGAGGPFITSVTITESAGAGGFALANFRDSATPEPGSLLLMGSGLVGLAMFARRRFNR